MFVLNGVKVDGWWGPGRAQESTSAQEQPAGSAPSPDRHAALAIRESRSTDPSTSASLAPRTAAMAVLPDHGSAYEHWQERARKSTVEAGSYSVSRVGKEFLKVLANGAQAGVGAIGAAGATALLATSVGSKHGDGVDGQVLALAAGPALATAATTLLGGLVSAISKGRLTKPEALAETFKRYVADSAEDLKTKPEHIKRPIRKIDFVLGRICAFAATSENVDIPRFERLLKWRQEFLMAMDRPPKVVQAWTTREGRSELKAKIRDAVQTFPEEVRKDLASVMRRIAANSVLSGRENQRRLQFRFKGPGGTGKDTFMKILKDTLGIPVIELVVPPERDGGVEALLGKSWAAIEQPYYSPSDEELFGELGLALIKSGYSNSIIYLNEIKLDEKGVVNGLKRLLDPARDSLDYKSLDSQLDMSGHTIFVASNDNINPDAALESRWETIELARATRETKQSSALKMYELETSNYKRPLADGHAILSLDQREEMNDLFHEMLPLLLDAHEKKLPGARMDFVRSVVTFIASKMEDMEIDALNKPEMTKVKQRTIKGETRKFILDYYERMQESGRRNPPATPYRRTMTDSCSSEDVSEEEKEAPNKSGKQLITHYYKIAPPKTAEKKVRPQLITEYYARVPRPLTTNTGKEKISAAGHGEQGSAKVASSSSIAQEATRG